VWAQKNCRGTVIATSKGRLIVWDGANSNFSMVETGRGDIGNTATFPNVAMIRPEKVDGGNLYFVSKCGVVAKFFPK
jgi:hypothetical protein